jgi:hypothetical protein
VDPSPAKSPQVGVGDGRELGLYLFELVTGDLEARVCSVVRLGGETHRGAVATAVTRVLVIGTRRARERDEHGSGKIAAIL